MMLEMHCISRLPSLILCAGHPAAPFVPRGQGTAAFLVMLRAVQASSPHSTRHSHRLSRGTALGLAPFVLVQPWPMGARLPCL